MTLIVHSGTAAVDLSLPREKTFAENLDDRISALEKSVEIKSVPNVSALADTTKDWVYLKGIHLPRAPIDLQAIQNAWQYAIGPMNSSNVYLTTSTPYVYGPPRRADVTFSPLPAEKREMPVIGYRAWFLSTKFRLGHGLMTRLNSTGMTSEYWKRGVNRAICAGGGRHHDDGDPPPSEYCSCGYYVLANLDEVESHVTISDLMVVGAVMGWGKVIQHGTEGWRAEYARILGLLDCQFSKRQLTNTKTAANAYGVEVYSRTALEAYVREWGDPFQREEVAVGG